MVADVLELVALKVVVYVLVPAEVGSKRSIMKAPLMISPKVKPSVGDPQRRGIPCNPQALAHVSKSWDVFASSVFRQKSSAQDATPHFAQVKALCVQSSPPLCLLLEMY